MFDHFLINFCWLDNGFPLVEHSPLTLAGLRKWELFLGGLLWGEIRMSFNPPPKDTPLFSIQPYPPGGPKVGLVFSSCLLVFILPVSLVIYLVEKCFPFFTSLLETPPLL